MLTFGDGGGLDQQIKSSSLSLAGVALQAAWTRNLGLPARHARTWITHTYF